MAMLKIDYSKFIYRFSRFILISINQNDIGTTEVPMNESCKNNDKIILYLLEYRPCSGVGAGGAEDAAVLENF